MIVDTSALISILFREADAPRFTVALGAASNPVISAVTLVETTIVSEGRSTPQMVGQLEALLHDAGVEIVPVTAEQARIAQDGWRRYGKGRHPAGLNFGDCFAYALAKSRDEPLLFKGDDFAQTDVKAAI
ncbi:type II toxin-antitoxin system VapC family toxin [Roseococcus sp. SYP-B2431]|uniref:type II toxin-antitoxin system VapC family toxin n=1 Tax=Roseococcus sp. SYP-B2431 TaxID=2496640 RepID=UPI00103C151E|nr:type II toxin-antitoxin system VapC family toxin [Roseococcus sp. SYP-B2431]TCH97453.1 type II toxin-antitoxin system VapC family toxin [Roseococcus sp. SYP-B2431]